MTRRAVIAAGAGALAFLLAGRLLDLDRLALTRLCVCGAALGAAAAFDLTERRIPNRIVLPAAAVCLLLTVADGVRPLALAPACAVIAALLLVSLVRPDALGMGDVKLALLIAMGLDGVALHALILGFALAAGAGLMLIARHGRTACAGTLPLAPFLAAGSLLALL